MEEKRKRITKKKKRVQANLELDLPTTILELDQMVDYEPLSDIEEEIEGNVNIQSNLHIPIQSHNILPTSPTFSNDLSSESDEGSEKRKGHPDHEGLIGAEGQEELIGQPTRKLGGGLTYNQAQVDELVNTQTNQAEMLLSQSKMMESMMSMLASLQKELTEKRVVMGNTMKPEILYGVETPNEVRVWHSYLQGVTEKFFDTLSEKMKIEFLSRSAQFKFQIKLSEPELYRTLDVTEGRLRTMNKEQFLNLFYRLYPNETEFITGRTSDKGGVHLNAQKQIVNIAKRFIDAFKDWEDHGDMTHINATHSILIRDYNDITRIKSQSEQMFNQQLVTFILKRWNDVVTTKNALPYQEKFAYMKVEIETMMLTDESKHHMESNHSCYSHISASRYKSCMFLYTWYQP